MRGVLRLVVLSDTHIGRRFSRRLPDAAYDHLAEADVILHAGDILTADFLDELRGFAPVHAVLGNNDVELVGLLPETEVLRLEGVELAMVHDSGPAPGRVGRMHRRFPSAGLMVFGHSHIPWNQEGLDGQILFNPGSPTDKRRQPDHTLGRIDLSDGRVVSRRIEVV